MPSRIGAVHVATTSRHYKNTTYHTHLLRRTFRHDGIKHETLGNISHLPDHIIELVRRALKGESLVNAAFTCLRSYPHGHVAAVLGSLKQLGLHTLMPAASAISSSP